MKRNTVKFIILGLLFPLLTSCGSHSNNKVNSSSHIESKKIKHHKLKKKTDHKQAKKEESNSKSENTSVSQVAESAQSQSVPINEVSSAQSVVSTPNTTPPPANNTPSQNNEQPNKTQVIEHVIIREVPKKEETTSSYIESFSQVESYSSEIAPDPEPGN